MAKNGGSFVQPRPQEDTARGNVREKGGGSCCEVPKVWETETDHNGKSGEGPGEAEWGKVKWGGEGGTALLGGARRVSLNSLKEGGKRE